VNYLYSSNFYYFRWYIPVAGIVELAEIEMSASLQNYPTTPTWTPQGNYPTVPAPVDWTPQGNYPTVPPSYYSNPTVYSYNALRDTNSGIVTISASHSLTCDGYRPQAVADGNYNDCNPYYSWRGMSPSRYIYLQVQLQVPLIPTSYAFYYQSNCSLFGASSHSVYGSNDGINWNTLVYEGGPSMAFYELYFDYSISSSYTFFRILFKDTYVVDIAELELRGYYDPIDGTGGQELCSDNVLTNNEVTGGVVITASDTEVTSDIWSQTSPNALIDGRTDCQLNTGWKSGYGQTHSIFIDTIKPIVVSSLSITAPYNAHGCSGDYHSYTLYVYGSTDGFYWNWISMDNYYYTLYSGNTAIVNFYSVYQAYKHFKIDFYAYQVELSEIALKGCYEPGWHLENESSLAARLTRIFGSTGNGVGVIVGVCLFGLFALVGIVIVIRRRRANVQTINDEEELEVINENYHNM